jgi:hypothetical protein
MEFELDLTGNFASQLAPANKALGETDKKMEEVKKATGALEVDLGKLGSSAAGINLDKLWEGLKGGGFAGVFTLGISEGIGILKDGAEFALDVFEKILDTSIEIGKAILDASAKRQDLDLALNLNAGAEGAEAIGKLTDSFKNTRFAPDQIKAALLPLTEVGVKDTQLLDNLGTAAIDIATRRNSGIGGVQGALESFQRIFVRGEVSARMLTGLGINEKKFFDDLGANLHVSAEEAKKLVKEGKVKSDVLLNEALQQIAQREGGELGNAALQGAHTLGGAWDRLKALPEQFMARLSQSGGASSLTSFLDRLIEKLDPDGPTGQRIIRGIERIEDSILGLFDDMGGTSVIDDLVDGLASLAGGFEKAMPFVKLFGHMLGVAYDWGKALFEILGKVGGALIDQGDKIARFFGLPGLTESKEEQFATFAASHRTKPSAGGFTEFGAGGGASGAFLGGDSMEPTSGSSTTVNNSTKGGHTVTVEQHFHGPVTDPRELQQASEQGARTGLHKSQQDIGHALGE